MIQEDGFSLLARDEEAVSLRTTGFISSYGFHSVTSPSLPSQGTFWAFRVLLDKSMNKPVIKEQMKRLMVVVVERAPTLTGSPLRIPDGIIANQYKNKDSKTINFLGTEVSSFKP